MSSNNNNPPKSVGGSTPSFGGAGMFPGSSSFSQSQGQGQMGSGFQGQLQLSQAQALAQAHAQAQAQRANAQFQAQLQAQGYALSQNQGIGNMGASSAAALSALGNAAKRMPQKTPMRPPGMGPSNMVSPLKAMELSAAAARRKKQKLPEKQLQEKVAALLPESALYTQLLEFEGRVDAALLRKKIDIQEALKNPPCVQKTLRIYVFNTFANQIRTIPQKPNAEPPTWSLKIVGRILEDGVDPDQPGVVQRSNHLYPKFSAFFKRVTICLRKRILAMHEAEKVEEKRAREKILQKVEADKAERRSKHGDLPRNSATAEQKSVVQGTKNTFSMKSSSKAERMRDCVRMLKCNYKDDDIKVRRAFQTLMIYVGNTARNPDVEKYRKIRINNPVFQDRVGSMRGGIAFLELCGFEKTEDGKFLYLPREKLDITLLNVAGRILQSAVTNPFFGAFTKDSETKPNGI